MPWRAPRDCDRRAKHLGHVGPPQGIDRLGEGLSVEAHAVSDGLVEAFSARPCGGDVLAVQWHPEWDVAASASSRAFFSLIGQSLGTYRDR